MHGDGTIKAGARLTVARVVAINLQELRISLTSQLEVEATGTQKKGMIGQARNQLMLIATGAEREALVGKVQNQLKVIGKGVQTQTLVGKVCTVFEIRLGGANAS